MWLASQLCPSVCFSLLVARRRRLCSSQDEPHARKSHRECGRATKPQTISAATVSYIMLATAAGVAWGVLIPVWANALVKRRYFMSKSEHRRNRR